jgi:hypothetical protein
VGVPRAGLSSGAARCWPACCFGSPVLLETLNFWSGTLNYALVLLLVAAQLGAGVWARGVCGRAVEGFRATSGA